MTAFATQFPGSLSAGLNALSSPLGSSMMGGGLPAPLLAQLLGRVGGGMPGSLAPQIPLLPGASRGAAGPVPSIGPAMQPPQNNLLSLVGGLGSLGRTAGDSNSLLQTGLTPGWSTSGGLFGGAGPLFGGPLQGPTPGGATLDTTGLFGLNGWLAGLFGGSAGGAAAGAAATDAPLAGLGDLLGFTAFL